MPRCRSACRQPPSAARPQPRLRLYEARPRTHARPPQPTGSRALPRPRDTTRAPPRGPGEGGPPGLRLRAFCPPHVPVYTLRQGPTLGRNTPDVVRVMRW